MGNTRLLAGVLLILGMLSPGLSSAQNPDMRRPGLPRPVQNQKVSGPFGKIPMMFEANQGQVNSEARFVSHGPGYSAYLTAGGMVLSLRPTAISESGATSGLVAKRAKQRTILKFNLLGSAPNPAVIGEEQMPGHVNYFLGNDPRQWRTNVALFARVRYKAVYPGIDLVYYGNAQHLEYDFEVSAGADPNLIRFEIQGANHLEINANGDLVLKTSAGELHFQSPVVYQLKNGQRMAVKGAYILSDSSHVRFQVAQYDPSSPLVIDPVLLYSTYFGGNGNDEPHGIAVDSLGSIYLAGSTDSTDLPGLSQPAILPAAFVAKFDPTGSSLVYEDYLGGADGETFGYSLALNGVNEVYVTGTTNADDFPTVSPLQTTLTGNNNGFVTRISADGSALLYSTYLGGSSSDAPSSIAVDQAGAVYVAGSTSSTDFPTFAAYQSSMLPNQAGQYGYYGFLTKFSADGSALLFSTYFGGNLVTTSSCWNGPCMAAPTNFINGLALDGSGNAYVAGITATYNFPVSGGAYLAVSSPQQNGAGVGFVSKFDTSGGLAYSTYLYGAGGSQTDILAISVDSTGSAYVTGQTTSDGSFPITSTSICDPTVYGASCGYAFVTKFDPAGSSLSYSTFLGPNNFAAGYAIALDSLNDAYVLSMTQSGSFATVNGIQPFEDIATTDLLLVEIDPLGATQLFATYLGGATGDEYPAGIAVDTSGNIYVGGETFSSDFPTTVGAFQTALDVAPDAFVLKIGPALGAGVSATPSSFQYAAQPIGSTSTPASTLLRNMGSEPLLVSSIFSTGDFSESDTCGTSVAAAASCTISIAFTPSGPGVRTGTIVIQDNAAAGSPQVIALSGYASGPAASVDHSRLTFASTPVGSSSQAQNVTLTNTGDTGLVIGGIEIGGDFWQTSNCPATLPAGSSCEIKVGFTPSVAGTVSGTLAIVSNAWGSPMNIGLSGGGADFSFSGSQLQATVIPGGIASFSLSVRPVGGAFSNAIHLTCTGAPANSACSVAPSATTPGSMSVTLQVAVNTAVSMTNGQRSGSIHPGFAMLLQLQGLGLIGAILAGVGRRPKKFEGQFVVAFVIIALLLLSGCAAPTRSVQAPPGPTAGTYTLTVTGTSGTLQHSIPLTLIVQ